MLLRANARPLAPTRAVPLLYSVRAAAAATTRAWGLRTQYRSASLSRYSIGIIAIVIVINIINIISIIIIFIFPFQQEAGA